MNKTTIEKFAYEDVNTTSNQKYINIELDLKKTRTMTIESYGDENFEFRQRV